MSAPGWFPDPTGRFEFRWYDGNAWTASVSRAGAQLHDPIDVSPAPQMPLGGIGGPPLPHHTEIPMGLMSSEPATKSRTSLFVGVGLVVVAAAAVALIVVGPSDSKKADSAVAVPASTAVPSSQPPASTSPDVAGAPGDETSRPVEVVGSPLPLFPDSGTDPAVGTPAPVLHGYSFDGSPVTIDAAADGPYMVVFLAHWCPHCNREIPRLIQWQADGGIPAELKIVGVATAVGADAPNFPPRAWLAGKGWPWPAMIDESQGDMNAGVAATALGATGWPYFVIIGADGLVKVRFSGEIDISDLQPLVAAALAN
jgi:thiol-disulfide isomerase/thioredoxin